MNEPAPVFRPHTDTLSLWSWALVAAVCLISLVPLLMVGRAVWGLPIPVPVPLPVLSSPLALRMQFALGVVPPLVVFAIVYLLVWLPRSIEYTLTVAGLVISGGWTRIRIPYTSIARALAASPPGGPWKTWGLSLPGLYWGGFWWRQAGGSLRLYATRQKPLVLITAGGTTYGISPADAAGFLGELRRRLSMARVAATP